MANVKNVHDIIIGTGVMYINGVDVGQLKGNVSLKHAKTFYEEKAGVPSTSILKALVEEGAELTASLLEVNLDAIAGLMVEYTIDTEGAGSATITQEHVGAITSTRKTGLAHPKLTNDAVTVALASTLSAAVIATDTVLPVVDASIFTAGDTITLRLGSATENATIDADGVDAVANTLTITAGLSAGFAAGASVLLVVQLQDLLDLSPAYASADSRTDRINVPGTVADSNWTWRMPVTLEDLAADPQWAGRVGRSVDRASAKRGASPAAGL